MWSGGPTCVLVRSVTAWSTVGAEVLVQPEQNRKPFTALAHHRPAASFTERQQRSFNKHRRSKSWQRGQSMYTAPRAESAQLCFCAFQREGFQVSTHSLQLLVSVLESIKKGGKKNSCGHNTWCAKQPRTYRTLRDIHSIRQRFWRMTRHQKAPGKMMRTSQKMCEQVFLEFSKEFCCFVWLSVKGGRANADTPNPEIVIPSTPIGASTRSAPAACNAEASQAHPRLHDHGRWRFR